MSHIHLPDGILPVWLWVLGYIIIGLYLVFLTFYIKKSGADRKIALVGVMSALMVIAMSIEIIPPAYHTNLAVVSGMVLGPVLSPLAALASNIILALLGHGGMTTIGLNTLVISVEALAGYWIFKLLSFGIKNIFASALIATILALFISAWTSIGIIYLGTQDINHVFVEHEGNEKVISLRPETEMTVHIQYNNNKLDFRKLIGAVITLGSLGWVIEGFITAFIVVYIKRIKPELIETL